MERGYNRASRVEIRSETGREQGGGHGVVAWLSKDQRHVVLVGKTGREALW